MFSKADSIQDFDNELWAAIAAEEVRQEEHIELIAFENYTSARVMQAPRSNNTQSSPCGQAIRTDSTVTSPSGDARPLFGE